MTTTFDGWEARLYGDAMSGPGESLAHFRTKGSKNGVRRYQLKDGTWTPLGLKERKAREGWGEKRARRAEKRYDRKISRLSKKMRRADAKDPDSERSVKLGKKISMKVLERNRATGAISNKEYKEIRRDAKEQDRVDKIAYKAAVIRGKAAAKQAKKDARAEAIAKSREKKRQGDLSKLTDEELRKKIDRVKMEQEYKELTKSPLLKTGEKIFNTVMDYKARKTESEAAKAKANLDNNRIKSEIIKAKEATKQKKAEAEVAKQERKKMKIDAEAGLADKREKELIGAKLAYKNSTIRGGLQKAIAAKLSAGVSEKAMAERKAKGEVEANRIKSEGHHTLLKAEADRAKADAKAAEKARREGVKAYEKEQTRLRNERLKTQEEYRQRAINMQKQAEESRKRMESLERQRQQQREAEMKRREAEAKRREEEEKRRRRKAEKKLQKAYGREIDKYDRTFHNVLNWND